MKTLSPSLCNPPTHFVRLGGVPRCRNTAARRGCLVQAEARGSAAGSGPGRGRGGKARKARQAGMFEVQDVTPPKRSLGIHALPPTTHNGDVVEVEGEPYVVQSVVMQFKLVKGKYQRDHARLEVQHTGRFLYNAFLEEMFARDSSHLGPEEDR